MKILHIANHCKNSGNGIVNVAVDLACKQASEGHKVSFASGPGEYSSLLKRHGVRYIHVDQRRTAPVGFANGVSALWRELRGSRPDIVHAHMMTGAVLGRLMRPACGYGLVTTVHNEFQRSASLMRVGDRVIAISDAVAEALIRRGFDPKRVRVIKNGPIGSPRRAPDESTPNADLKRPAIVTVAGLNDRKGIVDLLDAFDIVASRAPDAHLYIVGDGPERQKYQAHAQALTASDRVIFAGFQPDPRPFLNACDTFVLASHDEPFGLALVEAREAGCSIVATNVGGIPEVLDHGEAGLLVPPRAPEALAEAIGDVLLTPGKGDDLRRRARVGLEAFSVDRLNEETLRLYQELALKQPLREPSGPLAAES